MGSWKMEALSEEIKTQAQEALTARGFRVFFKNGRVIGERRLVEIDTCREVVEIEPVLFGLYRTEARVECRQYKLRKWLPADREAMRVYPRENITVAETIDKVVDWAEREFKRSLEKRARLLNEITDLIPAGLARFTGFVRITEPTSELVVAYIGDNIVIGAIGDRYAIVIENRALGLDIRLKTRGRETVKNVLNAVITAALAEGEAL